MSVKDNFNVSAAHPSDEPRIVRMEIADHIFYLTEEEVEWLIWRLRRAAYGRLMTRDEMFPGREKD